MHNALIINAVEAKVMSDKYFLEKCVYARAWEPNLSRFGIKPNLIYSH